MKRALFTICAKNYIGLSLTLKQAVEQYASDVDFYIYVADECDPLQLESLPQCAHIAKDVLPISPDIWESMSYKYNLVEFCTALKPFSFQLLMQNGYEKIIYCDPDIFFFSKFDFIYDDLDTYQAILTPHEIHPQNIPSMVCRDYEALRSGVFNLGFAAFRTTKTTREIMKWWGNRLEDFAVSEVTEGLFTDQKWMDFLPAMLPEGALKISKHFGMNCAPWNYHEREIMHTNDGFRVQPKFEETDSMPLVFFHCAGYNYRTLMNNNPQSAYLMTELTSGIRDLLQACSARLMANDFEKYLPWSYTYSTYNNGDSITYFQRRMYRRLNNEGFKFQNLFSNTGDLYRLLKKNKLIYKEQILAEKTQPTQITGFEAKISLIDFFVSLVKKAFGPYKYALFCKLMNKYFRYENQVRLLDKSYKNIRIR